MHHPAHSLVTILNDIYNKVEMHVSRLLTHMVHTKHTVIKGDVWKCPAQPLRGEQS
jgi:hypothetical protein